MTEAEIIKTMRRLGFIARAMDTAWQVPFTKIRFGVDPVLGLIPGGGDVAATLVSLYMVLKAHQMGAPKSLLLRMGVNIALDAGGGAIPIVGDIFDVLFKSNIRNLDLLYDFVRQKGIVVE